jgi:hypothetical protein
MKDCRFKAHQGRPNVEVILSQQWIKGAALIKQARLRSDCHLISDVEQF